MSFMDLEHGSIAAPYSADGPRNKPSTHNLRPCSLEPDDSWNSRAFIIQYINEEVSLIESFRLSFRRVLVSSNTMHPTDVRGSILFELFFSNTKDTGGVDHMLDSLKCPPNASFNIVARGAISVSSLCTAQYFRVPLDISRDGGLPCELTTGDMFPCSYIEGLFAASLIRIEPLFGLNEEEVLREHKIMVEVLDGAYKHMVSLQSEASPARRPLTPERPDTEPSVDAITEQSTLLLVNWTDLIKSLESGHNIPKFKRAWRDSLNLKASQFVFGPANVARESTSIGTSAWFPLSYPLETSRVPILTTDFSSRPYNPIRCPQLVVVVHGYQGTATDVRVIRNTVAFMCPTAQILISVSNEDQTEGDIGSMGIRLAMEIHESIRQSQHTGQISFIAHSLGGLIVRSALPHLEDLKDRFNVFISLSTPHLGITDGLISGGIQLMQLFKRSEALGQMTMLDNRNRAESFLGQLSIERGPEWFQRVVAVGSEQDQYAPISSSTIQPAESDRDAWVMARNIIERVGRHKLARISADFRIPSLTSIDSVIGRAAHIQFLESSIVLQQIMIIHSDLLPLE